MYDVCTSVLLLWCAVCYCCGVLCATAVVCCVLLLWCAVCYCCGGVLCSLCSHVWGQMAVDWDTSCKKKWKQIRELAWRGVPNPMRTLVWPLLAGVGATKDTLKERYPQLLAVSSLLLGVLRQSLKMVVVVFMLCRIHWPIHVCTYIHLM